MGILLGLIIPGKITIFTITTITKQRYNENADGFCWIDPENNATAMRKQDTGTVGIQG